MRLVDVSGAGLELLEGSGEPVVLVSTALTADELPLWPRVCTDSSVQKVIVRSPRPGSSNRISNPHPSTDSPSKELRYAPA